MATETKFTAWVEVSKTVRLSVAALQEVAPELTSECWELALSRMRGVEIAQPGSDHIFISLDEDRCSEPFPYFWSDLMREVSALAKARGEA